MAPISSIATRGLSQEDLPAALLLSAEAGWNQAAEDWALFLEHGRLLGVPSTAGLTASAAILPYDGFAWISMVLVTAAARGQGLGTGLLQQALGAVADAGQIPVLDATPSGERIYRPLGFRPVFRLTRWRGQATGTADLPPAVRPAEAEDLPAITALDATAFGAARPGILAHLWRRAPRAALTLENGQGFVLARPGREAMQIGPLVAPDEASAATLLRAALGRLTGTVLLDVPDARAGLAALLEAEGFRRERPFLRMALQRTAAFGDPARLYAVAGPELG